MSSAFCSMEEAFVGPLVTGTAAPLFPGMKPPKQKRRKDGVVMENFVPAPPDRQVTPPPAPEVLRGPSIEDQQPNGSAVAQLESGTSLQDFFPLPGETASMEEWTKAFMLEPSANPGIPVPRFDGSVSVTGKPTLWRQVPVPRVAAGELAPIVGQSTVPMAPAPSEISQRLDTLTRQLDALAAPAPMQSTAELFLFVAIGLLLLLAIDTLLRFAVSIAKRGTGVSRRGGRASVGRTVRVRV